MKKFTASYPPVSGCPSAGIIIVILSALILSIFPSCAEEPVPEDYFNDEGRIAGGIKPGIPVFTAADPCFNTDEGLYQITVSIGCGENTEESGGCLDSGGDPLYFLIYSSSSDPSGFASQDEYYRADHYCCYTDTAGEKTLYSSTASTEWIWITAFDGGRESDHSSLIVADFPSAGGCVP